MDDLSLEIESYMDFLWEVGDEPPTKDDEKDFRISKHSLTDSSESFCVAHDPIPILPSESSKVMNVFLIES